jgi:hypothetical protein
MQFTIKIELFKGLKIFVSIGNLVDSLTHRYGESLFEYEYLREFEAKIGTARNLGQSDLFKKLEKFGSLPCPFNGWFLHLM